MAKRIDLNVTEFDIDKNRLEKIKVKSEISVCFSERLIFVHFQQVITFKEVITPGSHKLFFIYIYNEHSLVKVGNLRCRIHKCCTF